MKKITKKRLIGLPIVAILVIVAVIGIAGGVYAANVWPATPMTAVGTLDVTDPVAYNLDSTVLNFSAIGTCWPDATSFPSANIHVTNNGENTITSLAIGNIVSPPFGVAGDWVGTATITGGSIAPLATAEVNITFTYSGSAIAVGSKDFSSLTCDITPAE